MVSIFDFDDYRLFLRTWLKSQKTKGLQGKLAEAANISSSMMSLILKEQKQLSLEQAVEICEHIGFNKTETQFFLALVEFSRAGTEKLRLTIKLRIAQLQLQMKKAEKRVKVDRKLSDENKSIFYSSWVYSAIRNASAIEHLNDEMQISERLGIPVNIVRRVLQFLLENHLCIQEAQGLAPGPATTHVSEDSPHVNKHHQNWRHKAINKMEVKDIDDLFFTMPMSLSRKDYLILRSLLLDQVSTFSKIVGPSTSEEVACLNMDLFRI